jgi:hypothetical protein
MTCSSGMISIKPGADRLAQQLQTQCLHTALTPALRLPLGLCRLRSCPLRERDCNNERTLHCCLSTLCQDEATRYRTNRSRMDDGARCQCGEGTYRMGDFDRNQVARREDVRQPWNVTCRGPGHFTIETRSLFKSRESCRGRQAGRCKNAVACLTAHYREGDELDFFRLRAQYDAHNCLFKCGFTFP